MKKIKVTQVRSIIKRNETQKRTIQALGLGKINRSRVHDDSSSIRGMINKVRHLVVVEDVVPEEIHVKEPREQAVKAETETFAAETTKPEKQEDVKAEDITEKQTDEAEAETVPEEIEDKKNEN